MKNSKIQKNSLPEALEDKIHISIIDFLERISAFYYHIPNGGYRNQAEGAKLKRMGVKAGIPDICIPIPIKPYHGLYLEIKRKRNYKISSHQKYIHPKLKSLGYRMEIVKSLEEAITIVREYFSNAEWENSGAQYLYEISLIKRKLAMFRSV